MEGDSEFDMAAAEVQAEPTPEPEPQESAEPETQAESGDEGTLDLLVNADELDWYRALSMELEKSGGASFKVSKEEMSGLPLEAQQLVHNAVQMARRAADKAARRAHEVSEQQQQLEAQRRQLAQERTRMTEFAKHPMFRQFLDEIKPKADADPWTVEGQESQVRGQVADLFEKFLERMAAAQGENERRIAEAEAAHQRELRTRELEGYIEKHQADFDDPGIYGQIKELVHRFSGTPQPLTAQEAHRMVMGMRGQAHDPLAEARRAARGRTGPTNGSATQRAPEAPEDFVEAGKFYRENPEALRRDLHKHLREGTGY